MNEARVSSFGERLRREREQRKISLEEVAKTTKIGTRLLTALEEENFAILPGGIFNKGFVRSYARFLGLDEDELVKAYIAAANEQPLSVEKIAAQSAMMKASKIAAQQARESARVTELLRDVVLLVLGVVLVCGAYLSYRHGYLHSLRFSVGRRTSNLRAQAPPSTAVSTPSNMLTQPTVPVLGTANSSASVVNTAAPQGEPSIPSGGFVLSIKTSEESWVSVNADGKRALQKVLEPNEQESVTAGSRVRMTIGNPRGTEVSLNGKPLVIGGDPERPRRIVVDANGLVSE